jgi:hypothetical protein
MSFLYPLLLAGIAAVALPIVLHMIRRHTRKRVIFSSLMFLRTTAPRLRNRSRLEHIPLLLLRCLILCLLALAFARPFLPRTIAAKKTQPGRRTVLLLDTSASMRRAGLWDRAVEEARSVLEQAGPSDRVCVMTFDQGTRMLIGFEQWGTMDPPQRAPAAVRSLSEAAPGWGPTNTGLALIAAAEAIEDDEIDDGQQAVSERRVVLISDCQRGSSLEALAAYEWPERTQLEIKTIPPKGTTNATLQLVTTRDPLAPGRRDDVPQIRVTNSPDATKDRFQLRWADDPNVNPSGATAVYVPPGHSIVVQAPARSSSSGASRLVLSGDDHDFDNTLYLAPAFQQQVQILYVGNDDANDVKAMLFYLRQAFRDRGGWSTEILARPGNEALNEADLATAHLVVVADPVVQAGAAPLRRYLESGRTILLVMRSAETGSILSALGGLDGLAPHEADVRRYAMLDSIDFQHPLFAPFSDPRFGDFTRIHFWRYRRIDSAGHPQARVLAKFDSGDPAWLEIAVGSGSLLVWTSGWHPADSDLALSSKFVPLLYSILEHGGTLAERQSQYFTGDSVPVPARAAAATAGRRIRRPDGSTAEIDRQVFMQTDLPGIYTMESPSGNRQFAINLFPAESRTDPIAIEEIEKMGVALEPVSDVAPADTTQAMRHRSFVQMESEQKLWRWVLVAALAMLLIEIWLGGWLARPATGSEGESP